MDAVKAIWDSILVSLKSQTATWFVGVLITVLTLFSSKLTEHIKFALNRADSRTHQYEQIATEISQYIFAAELTVEFIEKDWTTKTSLTELITDYNKSITTLRKNEYVYMAWIQKYWGPREENQFLDFMKSVKAYDSAVHSLNDEFEAVNITGKSSKIDRKRAAEALKIMKPALENMRNQGKQLLTSLIG
jgi:hypothetical protein